MEEKEIDVIKINDVEYMILEIIDKYYYLSEVNNTNNIRVFKENGEYIESIDYDEEEKALAMYYEKYNN